MVRTRSGERWRLKPLKRGMTWSSGLGKINGLIGSGRSLDTTPKRRLRRWTLRWTVSDRTPHFLLRLDLVIAARKSVRGEGTGGIPGDHSTPDARLSHVSVQGIRIYLEEQSLGLLVMPGWIRKAASLHENLHLRWQKLT